METGNYVERALGQNTEYDTLFEGISDYARTVARPLMRADEIRMMKSDQAILISGRQRPALFKSPPYYEVPAWHRWAHYPAAALDSTDGGHQEVPYLPLESRWSAFKNVSAPVAHLDARKIARVSF